MIALARCLVVLLALWTAAVIAAPSALSSSHHAIAIGAALVYRAGGFVCHQRPERSFKIGGRPMPVCARCAGLYVSALLGGVLALALGGVRALGARPLERDLARWLLAVAALPTLATIAVERAGLAFPSNAVRALSAIPLGLAAAWVVLGLCGMIPHSHGHEISRR